MKICFNRDFVRTCNHPMDYCDNCVPGYHRAVECVEEADLDEYAERYLQQARELGLICDELDRIYRHSNLGERNKEFLMEQIRRLLGVATQIMCAGNSLFLNRLLGNNNVSIPEEVSESGSDTGTPNVD